MLLKKNSKACREAGTRYLCSSAAQDECSAGLRAVFNMPKRLLLQASTFG
jgi:hypothetical protein